MHHHTGKPEVWLLSSYRTDSHGQWADWVTEAHSQVNWHKLELPGRRFRWRIRGNPLSWLEKLPDSKPDLILATSMVDLATIKGLHPRLAQVPCWYYFHENQFAYPPGEDHVNQIDPQMVQIYGGLAAEWLFFNSEFNRSTFLDGVFNLLKKKPQVDTMRIKLLLEKKTTVLPIPVEPIPPAKSKDNRLILWNHRWEYDKAPEIFAEAMVRLAEQGVDFRLALLGNRSSTFPNESLLHMREKLGDRIIADERADRATYNRIVSESGIVISTSLHEFQGLSILEAASAEARPMVPDALCYPEIYPVAYRYPPGDLDTLVYRLSDWLDGGLPPPVDVSNWYSPELKNRWQNLFDKLPG